MKNSDLKKKNTMKIKCVISMMVISILQCGCSNTPPDLKAPCDIYGTSCGQKYAINREIVSPVVVNKKASNSCFHGCR